MEYHIRYYEIAGITIQVESDLPINDATFDRKFETFRVEGPGDDTVVIRHHFGLPEVIPGRDGPGAGKEVYRKPPWAICRVGESWVYHGIAPDPYNRNLHQVAVFTEDHSCGDIYHNQTYRQAWSRGRLHSLTMFPTDQILVARLIADRDGCLLHSAGLALDGQGLVFVGHSDAGKSTTVDLVRRQLGNRAEILCDDRVILRGWPQGSRGGSPGFYAHGTWSHGDVPEVSSASAPLRGILLLEQHHLNELVPLHDRKQIWPRLLATLIKPMVTADWWRKEIEVLGALVAEVPCFTMRFDKTGSIVDGLDRLVR